MEVEHECTGAVPMDETVALKSPIAESRLLNLSGNTEVMYICETVKDSGNWMEDYLEKDVVLDSDDERGEQNDALSMLNGDCCVNVIRRFSGRDVTGLTKTQKVPDGCFGRRTNKVITNIHSSSARSVGFDDESYFLRTTSDNDTGNRNLLVIDSVISRAQDLKANSSNMKERHLDQENPNMVGGHLTENSNDEKALSLDKSKAIEKVVNYGWEHAKLSYIESPESAESQGKALDFVDHYLLVNDLGSSGNIETRKTNRIKSPPSLRSKGTQSLARKVNLGRKASKPTTFIGLEKPFMQGGYSSLRNTNGWIYAFEGDKSRILSINQESGDVCPQMKKASSLCSNENLAGNILNSNKLDTNSACINEVENVRSNSRCGVAYDFIKKLDKRYDARSFRQNVGKGEQVSLPPDTFDVGLDTQIAAEAMEALSNEASSMSNACFAHQGLYSRSMDPSSNLNKKSNSIQFVDSNEVFIGWSNKEKRSKCVKVSTVELNKNVSCSKNHSLSVSDGHCPPGRIPEINDVIKSDAPMKRRKIISFKGDVCKMGVRGERLNCGSFFQGTSNRAKREESYNLAVADSRLSKLNLWIHPKGKRFHPHVSYHSNKSINESSCDVMHEKIAENYSVVDKESHKRVARLLVYTRRRQVAAGRKHSGNYINLTGDSSSPSVNNDEYSGRQVEIPIDTVESSKEFSKLDDQRVSPFLETSGVTKLDALLNGNSETSQGCMGSDKRKQPFDLLANSPLMKELMRLGYADSLPEFLPKDLRRRRVMDKVCVLFSQSLDTKVLKQQRKIVARMGVSITTCFPEATHFVTDNFVRTRNILEAIARGKPVVTHSWLEGCEQAGYVIDEMRYVLRDNKKEKEIGFSMPVSLTRARQRPLLKGHRVFITPNVKPSADLILCLIEAVHGEVVKDVDNTLTKDKSIPNDLLFLSSEEDYTTCVPFLKKGASIYNSELLLNGIVIQKLEYDRHQLFKKFVGKCLSVSAPMDKCINTVEDRIAFCKCFRNYYLQCYYFVVCIKKC